MHMEATDAAAPVKEVGSEYRLRRQAPQTSGPALEATLAGISEEVTVEAQERRDRDAKLR
jgi:hypothetical protein